MGILCKTEVYILATKDCHEWMFSPELLKLLVEALNIQN